LSSGAFVANNDALYFEKLKVSISAIPQARLGLDIFQAVEKYCEIRSFVLLNI
jgi:hypothetical protein